MDLDIAIEGWPEGDWEDLGERAAAAIRVVAPELANPRLVASLLFASDARVHDLNRAWRAKDKPTNVLSFPMRDRDELLSLTVDGPPVMLGDIALAHATCAREAREKNIPLPDHAAHLVIHGLLHLAGYDHETNDEEAEKMETLEIKALAEIGVADPYGDHND